MPEFDVGTGSLQISLEGNDQITLRVAGGDTLYYAYSAPVNAATSAGSLTVGQQLAFTEQPLWIASAGRSTVVTSFPPPPTDISLGSDGTVGGPGGTPLSPTVPRAGTTYLLPSGADDSVPFNNAITQFAPFACPVVHLGPGTFLWNAVVPALVRGTPCKIVGAGIDKTFIKFSAGAPSFLDFGKVADYDVFPHVEITDLTFDNNHVGGQRHVIIGTYINNVQTHRISVNNLTLRRLKTINVPTDATQVNHRLNVWIVPYVASGDTPCTLNDHIYEDLEFNGGNMGLVVGASAAAGTASACTYDNIVVRRVKHDLGATQGPANFSSSNVQIGSQAPGGKLVIEDVIGANSGDVGIEIDQPSQLRMTGCRIQDAVTAPYLFRTFAAPVDGAQRQVCVTDNCEARVVNQVLTAGALGQCTGFYVGNASDQQAGTFVFRDCTWINETAQLAFGPNGQAAVGSAFEAVGPLYKIVLDRFTAIADQLALTPATNQQPHLIDINPNTNGQVTVNVRDLNIRLGGSRTGGAGTTSPRYFAARPALAQTKMVLNIDGYQIDAGATGFGGSGYPIMILGTVTGSGQITFTVRRFRVLNQGDSPAIANGIYVPPNTNGVVLWGRITDCDFRNMVADNEISIDSTQASVVFLDRIRWRVFPRPSAGITIGASPFTYQNLDGYPEIVTVGGGTVSSITRSLNGTDFSTNLGTTGEFWLENGDYLQVTYSVVPSVMTRFPTR